MLVAGFTPHVQDHGPSNVAARLAHLFAAQGSLHFFHVTQVGQSGGVIADGTLILARLVAAFATSIIASDPQAVSECIEIKVIVVGR